MTPGSSTGTHLQGRRGLLRLNTAEGLGKVIEKAFRSRPLMPAYIRAGSQRRVTVGLRYGDGTLVMKAGTPQGLLGRSRRSASTSEAMPKVFTLV